MKPYLLLLLATGCGSKNESPAPVTGPFTQAYVGHEQQNFGDVPVNVTKTLSATPAASWSWTSSQLTDASHRYSADEFHKVVGGETMTVTVIIPRKPTNPQNHFIMVMFYANKGTLAGDNTKPLARDPAKDFFGQGIILLDAAIMNPANYGPNGYVVTMTVTLP